MGWNNIWRYVLILFFLNIFVFLNLAEDIDLNYINESSLNDITNDSSLEEYFLKNLIKTENEENNKDKFKKHFIFFENSFKNYNDKEDVTSDENNYIAYQESIDNEDIKNEKRKTFNIITNEYVERYLKFWTTPKKISFIQESLNRAKPFIKEIKQILTEEGLPEELAYLPIIESGFKNNAYSRAKAVGAWQFIPHTAKWMGMKIDMWIDERKDPIIAARYAAKYLKFLYNVFDDWYLALAAYNHGGFNIKKSIKRVKSNDYFDLIKYKAIPRETRSYVTSFLALLSIIKNRENYNIQYEEDEINYDYIVLPFMVPSYLVSKNAEIDHKKFCELNPSLIAGFIPEKNYNYPVRLPKEKIDILNSNIEKLKQESFYSYIPYIVKEGDALSTIASKFRVSTSIIIHINNIRNPSYLRIGQRLYIPKIKPDYKKEQKNEESKVSESSANNNNYILYTVKKGDTIYSISLKFKINTDKLIKLNNISDPSKIRVGDQLRIYL